MEQNENIKMLLQWLKNPKNKIINSLIILFAIGFLMLTIGKLFTTENKKQIQSPKEISSKITNQSVVSDFTSYKSELEDQLGSLLSKVSSIGDVEVMITLENEIMIEPAFNTVDTQKSTEERDNEGGVRTIVEKQLNKQIVLQSKNNQQEPVILNKTTPKIKGVLIVADGASSPQIRETIIKSTATLLNIPIYRVYVLAK